MQTPSARKGATRAADIRPAVMDALARGEIESATLAEALAVDQARLVCTVFPELSSASRATAEALVRHGILKRMIGMGALLLGEFGPACIDRCRAHRSDTVRGWACFAIGGLPDIGLLARLEAVRPLADDAHFGVREWAWMAMRAHLVDDLDAAIEHLLPWTASPSERLRRFASEALRPRGVWCAHIAALKQQPQRALPILSALRDDPSVYVQDSVGNWLNDASKDQPAWTRNVCRQWLADATTMATRRICHRGLRSLAGRGSTASREAG